MTKRTARQALTLVVSIATAFALTGCSIGGGQQPPYGGYPGGQVPYPPAGQFPPIGQFPPTGQYPPNQGPIQLPPVPGKLNPGQLNPGQFGPGVGQVPGYGGIPGLPPLAPGAPQLPGVPAQPGAPGVAANPGAVQPGVPGAGPVFQPAAPQAPGSTAAPTAPGTTVAGAPAAPGSTLPGTTGNVSRTLPRFDANQIAQLEQALATIKGTGYEQQLTNVTNAANWTAWQKYNSLAQLASQIAAHILSSQAANIQAQKNYVAQFDPDQGDRVNKLMADVKGLDEAQVKNALREIHAKVDAEKAKQLQLAQAQAGAPAAQPGITPPPAAAGRQGAPAPMPGAPVQVLYIRMDS